MRLCTPLSLCLAAAAVLLPAPAPSYAAADPSCAEPGTGDFPLTTRIHGGPHSYRAGGGFGTWYLDLTNTTGRTCAGVHPVVVLVDARRALQPSQPHLEFYADGRPHPVRFETTDEDELVGALTDHPAEDRGEPEVSDVASTPSPTPFPGFTVPPGRTLTVKLRLALTSDAVSNEITANAAVVQRQGDDGEWVGQSNDYRFSVKSGSRPAVPKPERTSASASGPATVAATATATATADTTATAAAPASVPGSAAASASVSAPESDPSASASAPATGLPYLAEEAKELARTGLASPAGILAATVCLLATGAALLGGKRRR
ncbi:hypothetical protein ACH4F6_07020 [Streptomyces sp. NPDC017936]|uniref:hypothetical protein n=1 Tax=Streptomyces sp. NPDC017936 TaxID=3365016 RepID=UPI0037A5D0AE